MAAVAPKPTARAITIPRMEAIFQAPLHPLAKDKGGRRRDKGNHSSSSSSSQAADNMYHGGLIEILTSFLKAKIGIINRLL